MKKKALLLIIFIGLLVVLKSQLVSAAIDSPTMKQTPYPAEAVMAEGLLQSFWGGSGLYSAIDELCLSCHKRPFGPYTDDDLHQSQRPIQVIIPAINTANGHGNAGTAMTRTTRNRKTTRTRMLALSILRQGRLHHVLITKMARAH